MGSARRTLRIYRVQIPLTIVSFLITVVLLNYFTPRSPRGQPDYIKTLYDAAVQWVSISVGVGAVYGTFVVFLLHARRLVLRRGTPKDRFASITYLSIAAIFGIYGSLYSFAGKFYENYLTISQLLGAGSNTLKWSHQMYAVYVMMSRVRQIDSIVYTISWTLCLLNELNVVTYFLPQVSPIADWFATVPNVAVMRGSLIASGVGAIILGIRALVQREPGLIELEGE